MSVLSDLASNLGDCAELAEMASAEGDEEALAEVNAELDALQGELRYMLVLRHSSPMCMA